MSTQKWKRWTDEEIEWLIENYPTADYKEMKDKFKTKTYTIKRKVKQLGLVRQKPKVNWLMYDNPESLYWTGFIMADGHISENNRLQICISNKDMEWFSRFSDLTEKPINTWRGNCISTIVNHEVFPKFKVKYDIHHKKTYNPPSLNIFEKMSDLNFISYLVGFVDGDGHIKKVHKRKDCSLHIKLHESWLEHLIFFKKRLENIFKRPCNNTPKINNSGYAHICFSDRVILRKLKGYTEDLNLPVMKRKWGLLNKESLAKSRCEKSLEDKEKFEILYKKGFSNTEICKELNLSASTISNYKKLYLNSLL